MSILKYVIDRSGNNCWMGYKITSDNPLTAHHIIKDCDGGKKTLTNIAPLTKYAHDDYNKIEKRLPSFYRELQKMFQHLANTGITPDINYYIEMNRILKRISSIMELSVYFEPKSEIAISYAERKLDYICQNGILVPRVKRKQFDIKK